MKVKPEDFVRRMLKIDKSWDYSAPTDLTVMTACKMLEKMSIEQVGGLNITSTSTGKVIFELDENSEIEICGEEIKLITYDDELNVLSMRDVVDI